MTNHDAASSLLRAGDVLKPPEPSGSEGEDTPKGASGPSTADNGEISGEGCAVAAEHGATVRQINDLPPERILEIRRRIETRWYDIPEVVGEIAQRLYDSGDLGHQIRENDQLCRNSLLTAMSS